MSSVRHGAYDWPIHNRLICNWPINDQPIHTQLRYWPTINHQLNEEIDRFQRLQDELTCQIQIANPFPESNFNLDSCSKYKINPIKVNFKKVYSEKVKQPQASLYSASLELTLFKSVERKKFH